jgi:acetyltransferase
MVITSLYKPLFKGAFMDNYFATNNLRPFFEPDSIAIIGASRTPGKAGHRQILGLEVYLSLEHTPKLPTLVLIVLPPSLVLSAVAECAQRGVKSVIIESSGFSEIGEAGARLEREIAQTAKQVGMRVMGPNSLGTINPSKKAITSFPQLKLCLPGKTIRPGSVAFIGQTGLLAAAFLPLIDNDLEMSKVACLGNRCDVDECDMLEYLAGDRQTKVIAMYLESIKDGRRFSRLSRRIVKEKPIVVLKSAITPLGARVSASHTGSLAGEDRVYDAAFKQLGIIRVESFDQLFDVAKALTYSPLPRGNRVAIISMTGAGCVTAADACARNGLKIAELSADTLAKAAAVYPDWWRVKNPLDVWMAVETVGFEAAYTGLTRAALQDDNVDAAVVVVGAMDFIPGRDIPTLFKDIRDQAKPLLAVSMLGDRRIYHRMCQGFKSLSIPTYTSVEGAIGALAATYRYQQYRNGAGRW